MRKAFGSAGVESESQALKAPCRPALEVLIAHPVGDAVVAKSVVAGVAPFSALRGLIFAVRAAADGE